MGLFFLLNCKLLQGRDCAFFCFVSPKSTVQYNPCIQKMLNNVLLIEQHINPKQFCLRTMSNFCYFPKEMRWTNQPTEDLPKHLTSPPPLLTGHKTKILLIFSLHWHSEWPERILPWCYFYVASQLQTLSPTLCKTPTPNSLRKSRCLCDALGIWNWGKQSDFPLGFPFSYFSFQTS